MSEFDDAMEVERMRAWRLISPMSNLHSTGCGPDCLMRSHYPESWPISDDADDRTAREIDWLEGRLR